MPANDVHLTLIRGSSHVGSWTTGPAAVNTPFYVGSDPSTAWPILGVPVHPFHLQMVWDGQVLWVADASSTQDVRVNGVPIHQWHAVGAGSTIEFGGAALQVSPVQSAPMNPSATRIVSAAGVTAESPGEVPKPRLGSRHQSSALPPQAAETPDSDGEGEGDAKPASPDQTGQLGSGSSPFVLPPAPPESKKKSNPKAAQRRRILLMLAILLGAGAYLMIDEEPPPPSTPQPRTRAIANAPRIRPRAPVEQEEPDYPDRLPDLRKLRAKVRKSRPRQADEEQRTSRAHDAAEALITGDAEAALELYTRLADDEDANPAYRLIRDVVAGRRSGQRCIAGRRQDGTLCVEARRSQAEAARE